MNRPRISTRPQTAMELAFNRAAQQFADRAYKKVVPTAPPPSPQPSAKKK